MSDKWFVNLKKWLRQPANAARLAVMAVVLAALTVCTVWLHRPVEGEVAASASQLG